MLAFGAQIVATGAKGERVIAIDDFFVSLFTTSLDHGEILTEIRIPIPPAKSGGAYFKLERKVGDFATAAVAVQLTLDAAGAVQKVGIGLTNVGGTPIRAKAAEDALRGKKLDTATIGAAAQAAADAAQPSADLRGPVEYKKGLIKELTKRALARAAERAGK
jgi:carbon-monoxide dehydrogenase medium subunit